jgi:hypothetical protein
MQMHSRLIHTREPESGRIVTTLFASMKKVNRRATTLAAVFVLVALALPIGASAAAGIRVDGAESGTFQVLGSCSNGLILEVSGTGHSTYLGDYSGRYRECFDPATGVVADGSFTLTTTNGDMIFGTFTGQAVPAGEWSVHYDDPGVITGGTGRFTGASGSINTGGIANLATGEYNGTLSGSVSRPESP